MEQITDNMVVRYHDRDSDNSLIAEYEYVQQPIPRKGETVFLHGDWYDVYWVQHDLSADNSINVIVTGETDSTELIHRIFGFVKNGT